MSVTAAEFKKDPGKYLELSMEDDILITQDGKVIAKLVNPNADLVAIAKSLVGIIPADMTLEEAQEERLSKI